MKLSCFPDLLSKISPGPAFNTANILCGHKGGLHWILGPTMKLWWPDKLRECKKNDKGGCFALSTAYLAGLSRGIYLFALPFSLPLSFPTIGNNVYLLPLLEFGAGQSYLQWLNQAKVLRKCPGTIIKVPAISQSKWSLSMEVGGDKVLLDTGSHQLGWVTPSENPPVNARLWQGLGFIIFLGTKAFDFKSAYSSFWRNKHSMKLTKRFNSQYLIIPQSYVGQDFILKDFNTHRWFYRQHSRKLSFFPTVDFLSFFVGFQQITPKRKILATLSFPYSWCGHGVLSTAGNFLCIWAFLTFSSLKVIFPMTFYL